MRLACRACSLPLVVAGEVAECPRCGWRLEHRDGLWRGDDEAPPGFARERRDHLAELVATHFWFPARRSLLARRLDLVGRRFAAAIDLGCGTGEFLPELTRRASSVVGVDAYAESLVVARRASPRVELLAANLERGLPLEGGQFDLLVALDVLEHVAPAPFLAEVLRLAVPGAILLVAVPAGRWLWSPVDRDAGHRRRYGRRDLERELAEAGFAVRATTHYQMILAPLLFLARRAAGRLGRRVERRPPAALGRLLGAVNALEVARFGARRLPWGSSLIATAERAS